MDSARSFERSIRTSAPDAPLGSVTGMTSAARPTGALQHCQGSTLPADLTGGHHSGSHCYIMTTLLNANPSVQPQSDLHRYSSQVQDPHAPQYAAKPTEHRCGWLRSHERADPWMITACNQFVTEFMEVIGERVKRCAGTNCLCHQSPVQFAF